MRRHEEHEEKNEEHEEHEEKNEEFLNPTNCEKYYCHCCSFHTPYKSKWERHLKTIKHLIALEEYNKQNPKCLQQVIMINTFKQNTQKVSQTTQPSIKYSCTLCNFTTFDMEELKRHRKSKEHRDKVNSLPNGISNKIFTYTCGCGKTFPKKYNCVRHQQTCPNIYFTTVQSDNEPIDETPNTIMDKPNNIQIDVSMNEKQIDSQQDNKTSKIETMFLELVEQNKELQDAVTLQSKALSEQMEENKKMQQKLVELAEQPKNVTYNTQNNYNILNFLNEQYKNAMTIDDFLSSLQVSLEDLNCVREQGFVSGIGARIVKELQDLPEHERPVHFSQRRLKQYFSKQLQGWVKEDKEKAGLSKLIQGASNKHIQELHKLKQENQELFSNQDEYEAYQKTLFNIYKGTYTDKEGDIVRNKIYKMMENLTIENEDNVCPT